MIGRKWNEQKEKEIENKSKYYHPRIKNSEMERIFQ